MYIIRAIDRFASNVEIGSLKVVGRLKGGRGSLSYNGVVEKMRS